jgi:hypothetical protein
VELCDTPEKQYVEVGAEFTADGSMRPLWIRWTDGRKYEIDRISDCRRAASLRAGGAGLRYTCRIQGQTRFLFYEENYRWFVTKTPD